MVYVMHRQQGAHRNTRTALFNYLLNIMVEKFIIRIEDTDRKRNLVRREKPIRKQHGEWIGMKVQTNLANLTVHTVNQNVKHL